MRDDQSDEEMGRVSASFYPFVHRIFASFQGICGSLEGSGKRARSGPSGMNRNSSNQFDQRELIKSGWTHRRYSHGKGSQAGQFAQADHANSDLA